MKSFVAHSKRFFPDAWFMLKTLAISVFLFACSSPQIPVKPDGVDILVFHEDGKQACADVELQPTCKPLEDIREQEYLVIDPLSLHYLFELSAHGKACLRAFN
jgi:hypothetical protein